ncbi:hypothetical protein OUZ56_032715 [Daphnia magna]|nr:hypothetical protein OUZ56_032715 [Daphnia magna]
MIVAYTKESEVQIKNWLDHLNDKQLHHSSVSNRQGLWGHCRNQRPFFQIYFPTLLFSFSSGSQQETEHHSLTSTF